MHRQPPWNFALADTKINQTTPRTVYLGAHFLFFVIRFWRKYYDYWAPHLSENRFYFTADGYRLFLVTPTSHVKYQNCVICTQSTSECPSVHIFYLRNYLRYFGETGVKLWNLITFMHLLYNSLQSNRYLTLRPHWTSMELLKTANQQILHSIKHVPTPYNKQNNYLTNYLTNTT